MHLKKILALVLAFACAFTMFAGAAFTDQADIKATDAVNMLSSLGVITGYTDGSYQPNKVVTRAEMAKMIFVVRNNKIDDSAYESVGYSILGRGQADDSFGRQGKGGAGIPATVPQS